MARAQWIAAALTVTLIGTGVALLHGSEGAESPAPGVADALPSRALGLSGHRRLVRGLEHSGAHGPGDGTGQDAGHGSGHGTRKASAAPCGPRGRCGCASPAWGWTSRWYGGGTAATGRAARA